MTSNMIIIYTNLSIHVCQGNAFHLHIKPHNMSTKNLKGFLYRVVFLMYIIWDHELDFRSETLNNFIVCTRVAIIGTLIDNEGQTLKRPMSSFGVGIHFLY